jgi:gamma-glutamylcyclotransferase (GGCT)/AIG2-like uncharacterized protein YtfP
MADYLFTYGTLQPGLAPDEIAPAVTKLHPIGPASVPGVLYHLGDYPGAILDPLTSKRILGTIYQLPDDSSILAKLDHYEGFDPESPESSLFLRTRTAAVLQDSRTLSCWIYVYNGVPDSSRIISSGSFLRPVPAPNQNNQ